MVEWADREWKKWWMHIAASWEASHHLEKPHRRQPIDALQQPFEALGSGAHAAMYGSHWPQDWLSSVSVPDILPQISYRAATVAGPRKLLATVSNAVPDL